MTTPLAVKREEFRKYLEKVGILDGLTKALLALYDEVDKPEDGLEYLRSQLGDRRPPLSEIEEMRVELAEARRRVKELEEEVQLLRGELPQEDQEPEQPERDQ